MPGPQGPETTKAESDNKSPVASKADTPATELGPKEPPKTSPIDNSTTNSNSTATASTNGNTANTKTTTTTSNETVRVAGFRYYRDLGQK